jgi:hypothetical protein
MPKSVAQKIGVKNDARAILIDAPKDIINTIGLTDLKLAPRLSGGFDYIHFFAESVSHLIRKFPSLKSHLRPSGMLWISWRKGRKSGSDLTLTKIIKIGYDQGLVESKTLSVDAKWSAIKFTYPKEGKVYRNSYGRLKRD